MESIDAKVFAAIVGLTLALVEIFKAFFPKALEGRESKLALALPILLTVVAKAAGLFHGTDWVDAILWAVGSGASAGIGHDKVYDPVKGLIKGFFSKKLVARDTDPETDSKPGPESPPK